MKTKFTWTKNPSVRREGKYFFTTPGNGTRYWVTQNNHNTNWHVSDDCGDDWGDFKTSGEAIKAVESL
jgi:hypothetical protein